MALLVNHSLRIAMAEVCDIAGEASLRCILHLGAEPLIIGFGGGMSEF